MTNQTNLDYLFKLTAPLPERAAGGATSSNGRRPVFDEHLVSASASASGSSSTAAVRKTPSESAPPESDGPTSRRPLDDGYALAETGAEPADNPAPVDAATNSDSPEDAVAQATGGEGESAAAASSEDENVAEQDAAAELAATAAIAEHAAQTPQKDATLAEDQLADGTSGEVTTIASESPGNFDGDAERTARKLLAGELNHIKRARDDGAANVDITAQAQSLDSSAAHGGPERANASNSALAATNDDDTRQRESAARKRPGVSRAADDTDSALAKNVAAGAEPKPAKAIAAGRRGPSQNNETADQRRASASIATNRADANAPQNASAATVVANVASAQIATAGTGEASEEASRAVKPIGHGADGVHLTARAQRSGVAGSRRAHAAQAADLPRVDAARFVGRVAKAVQTAQDRGGLVQLRLSPPELGSLRLELTMQNGVMTAAVETETPAARQVLLDHLPALRERLAEQNIRIERFDVDVRQENSGGQADPRAQQEHRQHQPQQPNSRHAAGRTATTQSSTTDAPIVPTRLTHSELNLLA